MPVIINESIHQLNHLTSLLQLVKSSLYYKLYSLYFYQFLLAIINTNKKDVEVFSCIWSFLAHSIFFSLCSLACHLSFQDVLDHSIIVPIWFYLNWFFSFDRISSNSSALWVFSWTAVYQKRLQVYVNLRCVLLFHMNERLLRHKFSA